MYCEFFGNACVVLNEGSCHSRKKCYSRIKTHYGSTEGYLCPTCFDSERTLGVLLHKHADHIHRFILKDDKKVLIKNIKETKNDQLSRGINNPVIVPLPGYTESLSPINKDFEFLLPAIPVKHNPVDMDDSADSTDNIVNAWDIADEETKTDYKTQMLISVFGSQTASEIDIGEDMEVDSVATTLEKELSACKERGRIQDLKYNKKRLKLKEKLEDVEKTKALLALKEKGQMLVDEGHKATEKRHAEIRVNFGILKKDFHAEYTALQLDLTNRESALLSDRKLLDAELLQIGSIKSGFVTLHEEQKTLGEHQSHCDRMMDQYEKGLLSLREREARLTEKELATAPIDYAKKAEISALYLKSIVEAQEKFHLELDRICDIV